MTPPPTWPQQNVAGELRPAGQMLNGLHPWLLASQPLQTFGKGPEWSFGSNFLILTDIRSMVFKLILCFFHFESTFPGGDIFCDGNKTSFNLDTWFHHHCQVNSCFQPAFWMNDDKHPNIEKTSWSGFSSKKRDHLYSLYRCIHFFIDIYVHMCLYLFISTKIY